MKAKHVLMAMTLPIAFAACTEDEIVKQNNASFNNLDRPVVGEVSVVLGNEAVESMTRLANPETNAQDWSTGNLGACLMDEMKANVTGLEGLNKYTLSNKVYTDYPFNRVEKDGKAAWATTGLLLEGNYFFYYGNKANLTMDRSGFVYEIDTDQKALNNTERSNKFQAVTDNQLYVSYQGFVGGKELDGEQINLNLAPAHKQLNFSVKYEGESDIKIYKVELEAVDVPFMVSGALNPASFTYTGSYPEWQEVGGSYKEVVSGASSVYNLPDLFKWYNNDNIYTKYQGKAAYNPLNKGASFVSKATSAKIAVDLNSVEISKATDKTVSFAMIVPNNDATSYNVKIYTDKGIVNYTAVGTQEYKVNADDEVVALDHTASTGDYNADGTHKEGVTVVATAKLYDGVTGDNDSDPYAALNTQLAKLEAQDPQGLVLTFTNSAIKVAKDFEVKDYADLELYLGYHDFQSYKTKTSINATLAYGEGGSVELTDAAYNLIVANKDKFALNVLGEGKTLTIATTEATDALYKVVWGTNVKAEIAAGSTQVVNDEVKSGLVITNKGTLTINDWSSKDGEGNNQETDANLGDIFNLGTLTVSTKLASSTIYNGTPAVAATYDNVVAGAKASINADVEQLVNYAEAIVTVSETVDNNVVSNGAETPSYKVGDLTLAGANKTFTVVNNGDMTVSKAATIALTNSANADATFDADVKLSGSNAGSITNNAEVLTSAAFSNTGDFENNHILTVADGQSFSNTGKLVVSSEAEMTLITTNTGGTIEIAKRDPLLTVGNKQAAVQGTIVYTAKDADFKNGAFVSQDLDAFNKLIVSTGADFTGLLTDGTHDSDALATVVESIHLNVAANATFKFLEGASIKTLIVGDGKNTSRSTLLAPALTISEELTINSKATLYIHDTSVVTYTAEDGITNNGTVTAAGKFIATSASKPSGTFTGSGSNYTWKAAGI